MQQPLQELKECLVFLYVMSTPFYLHVWDVFIAVRTSLFLISDLSVRDVHPFPHPYLRYIYSYKNLSLPVRNLFANEREAKWKRSIKSRGMEGG